MTGSMRDITTAIASGDAEAFSQFYREWFDVVFADVRVAAATTRLDDQFCLDMVQETMLRVIRHMKPMDTEADVRRWLHVVAKSCCYDEMRRMQRRQRRERERLDGNATDSRDDHIDERLMWLRAQLRELSAEEVTLLGMRFRLGWTLERIGRAVGLKPGAVDGRISRSLAALRQRALEKFHE